MCRVLLTHWPFTGHLHPNLALAAELRRGGHQVAFYSGSKVGPTIEAAGHTFFPFQNVDEARVDEIAIGPNGLLSALKNPFRQKALWQEWVLETIPAQMLDIESILEKWKPDVIVCDPTMWAPFLIAGELHRIPVAVFSLIPVCYISGEQGPILGIPSRPPRTAIGRVTRGVLRNISDFVRRSVRTRATELRKQYGLTPLTCSVTDFAGQMPLYLVPGSRSFDYDRSDLPASVEYVGPCLWDGGRAPQRPPFLDTLPAGEPIIYASEGTVHHEPRLLRAVVQGMADRPVQVVITTGNHRDPATLDLGVNPLPRNVHVHRWIPLNALLPHLSAIVTIGGPSTMLAGLNAGIPVIITPFYWDHPESGLRVEASGAGICIPPSSCTPGRMREAIESVIHNPSYRQNARRLAGTFEESGGPKRAAALIERLSSGVRAAS